MSEIIVVGGGIFGLTAARTLHRRGYSVTLLDPGPVPHPLAASTDISKVIRMEYGPDETYMAMVELARDGWLAWNEQALAEPQPALYRETGVTMVTRAPMQPGSFEYESYRLLRQRGHTPERLDAVAISRRFPAWRAGAFVDGFFHAKGGYAESGRVVAFLLQQVEREGVSLHVGQRVAGFLEQGDQVKGVLTDSGERFAADLVIIAAGTWTQWLVPELGPVMKSVGQPVFHLQPGDPQLFSSPMFSVFTADISRSGWYGFPLHPTAGVVKIANHGPGQLLHPDHDERQVAAADTAGLRAFLAETFPVLVDAPIVNTRRCLYCDTLDEHFWIDHHPGRPGLFVAAGGSGHGFKFGPILGDLIADVVEFRPNPFAARFRWRSLESDTAGQEAARWHA
jgi:glycine/D-amino acid oxidase-like deaminating enzyme